MTDNPELMRDYEAWKSSLRNFAWLANVVPGATDIDVFIERRGSFLVIETKPWLDKTGVRLPFGQYLALTALAALPQFTVLLVGETDTDRLYVLNIEDKAGVKNSTRPVWYKSSDFTRMTQAGLAEMVAGWYEEADR